MSVTTTSTYPSLEVIMNAARVYLNDFQSSGAGLITTDSAPQTLSALNSAIRELYRELRITGAPVLIRDNVQIDLPANAVIGTNVQTYLSQQGYYDGQTLQASPVLPSDLLYPVELYEQQTTSVGTLDFVRMTQPQFGLPSRSQTFALGEWEWRGGATATAGTQGSDAIWFVGSLTTVTIRLRYVAALPQFTAASTGSFSSLYVPVMDCEDFLAYRIAYKVASAIAGITPATSALKAEADEALRILKLEVIKRMQTVDYHRQAYQSNFVSGYAAADNLI